MVGKIKENEENTAQSGEKHELVAFSKRKLPANPYLVLFIGVVGLSFGSFLVKLSHAPSLVIATYRNAFAVLLLVPFVFGMCRHEFKTLSLRDIGAAFASGVFLAFHFVVWMTSLDYTSVASSTVLVTMQPIFVVIGSFIFLKEKVPFKALSGGFLALAGSVIVGLSDFRIGGTALWGDFLALSGGVLIAGYMIIGRSLRQRFSLILYTFIAYGSCTMVLLVMDILSGTPLTPYPAREWLLFVVMALIPTMIGHGFLNWDLKYLPASTVSVSVLGEPIGASILAGIFLNEMPAGLQIAGAVLILTGIYLFMKLSQQ